MGGDRRPIATRERSWAQALAAFLVRTGARPNAISVGSIVFGAVAAGAIAGTEVAEGAGRWLWVAGAAGIQLRLLANMLDGMVAVDSGASSPVGELYNEIPDRVSDVLVLAALGFVGGSSPHLGWGAAVLAVIVAYVRAMGAVAGAGQVFAGVMAKPQRMFVCTVLCIFQAAVPDAWRDARWIGLGPAGLTLALISAGSAVTCITRLMLIGRALRARP